MIGSIRGILISKQIGNLVIEAGGLGYEVHVPANATNNLPSEGSEINLLTHFIVREDGHQLFGFSDRMERDFFRQLVKISGVGPRLALTILSGLDLEGFSRCVIDRDISSLVAIPGVGKKTAERLIVEMRDKLPSQVTEQIKITDTTSHDHFTNALTDAEQALISLGYRSSDARKMVATVAEQDQSLSSEELIRRALRAISSA